LETELHSALVRARAQGEPAADRDPLALGLMLLVLLLRVAVTP
jgi:TetR/AcrR family transcriptional repressor of nem operon